MGLLLSVLITCVGVLEVIACYTQFRLGVTYSECKSNIRDIAKYYAVELRKHELHFEARPDDTGPSTSQETLSELMRRRTVRTQEKSQSYTNGRITVTDQDGLVKTNGHISNATLSLSNTPDQGTPNLAANLKVPRNSISGLDSPTVQNLMSPELDITEAVEKIQSLEDNHWIRKSPSPYPDKSGLEVVEKDFWRSRSPSPFPDSKDSDSGVELIYTPGLRKTRDISPLLETPDIPMSPVPLDDTAAYSKADLEVQNITESIIKAGINRQPSPHPEALFGIIADTENDETKYDEAFLRSLDGVNKSSKCDDRRRSFRKKRNSSSTSSRASEISRSMTSLNEIDLTDKKSEVETKEIAPLTEEDSETMDEINGHRIRTETVLSEKCESISSPTPELKKNKAEAAVTKQEPTLFEAKVSPNATKDASDPGKANLSFTEKVKDLEISVQLLVTVKGTSQGDKMEYTTTVSQDDQKPQKSLDHSEDIKEETITKTTEEKSEFGNVKTSVTYGSSAPVQETPKVEDIKPNLKELQISSQSLIHAERTVQDDVATSEEEFLKLYESFTELPEVEKDKFLQKIGRSTKSEERVENDENIDNILTEIQQTSNKNTTFNQENIEVVPQIQPTTDRNLIDANIPQISNNTEEMIEFSTENNQNIPEIPKEKILITEITTITESTESVITIPPEKTINKTDTKNIKTADANVPEISVSDNATDNVEVISSKKECDQSTIENKNKLEIIESHITQKQVNNCENILDKKKMVSEPSTAKNSEITNVTQQITQTKLDDLKQNEEIVTKTIISETQPEKESEIVTTTIIERKSNLPETESIVESESTDNITNIANIVNTEVSVPEKQIIEKTIIEKQLKEIKAEEPVAKTDKIQEEKTTIIAPEKQIIEDVLKVTTEKEQLEIIEQQEPIARIEEIQHKTKSTVVSICEIPEKQITQETSKPTEKQLEITHKQQELVPTIEDPQTETITVKETTTTPQTNEISKKSSENASLEAPKAESSSESSSTPSTVLENPLRRASKIAFEEATPVQNQEMMKRRISNSEISPKQASQAFWEPEPSDTPAQVMDTSQTNEHI